MHSQGLGYRGLSGKLRGVRASACLLIAAGGCEPGSPEIQAPHDAPVELVLDTINVVHSDLMHYVRHVRRSSDGDLVVMNMGSTVEFYRVDDPGTALETPVELPGDELFVSRNPSEGRRVGMPAFSAWATYDLTWTGVIAADARDGRLVSKSSASARTRWTWST